MLQNRLLEGIVMLSICPMDFLLLKLSKCLRPFTFYRKLQSPANKNKRIDQTITSFKSLLHVWTKSSSWYDNLIYVPWAENFRFRWLVCLLCEKLILKKVFAWFICFKVWFWDLFKSRQRGYIVVVFQTQQSNQATPFQWNT